MSLSQRATCRVLSGHRESTSLFEAAEGASRKEGCSRDRWEGKKKERRRYPGEKKRGEEERKPGRESIVRGTDEFSEEKRRGNIGEAVERVRGVSMIV